MGWKEGGQGEKDGLKADNGYSGNAEAVRVADERRGKQYGLREFLRDMWGGRGRKDTHKSKTDSMNSDKRYWWDENRRKRPSLS